VVDAVGLGGEVLAVVELHALAQIEAPLERIDDFPSDREVRDDLEVLVALGEASITLPMAPRVKLSLSV
jgi:hypothetical protein